MIRFTLDSDEDYDGNMHCLGLMEDPQGEYVLFTDHQKCLKLLQEYFLHGDSGRFYDRVKDYLKEFDQVAD